jgi:hypothetical protein
MRQLQVLMPDELTYADMTKEKIQFELVYLYEKVNLFAPTHPPSLSPSFTPSIRSHHLDNNEPYTVDLDNLSPSCGLKVCQE